MEYRLLGRTGLHVSRITLGTVELGMDYGFRNSAFYRRPDPQEAIRLIHRALDLGVNLIDTARGYGCSEELIGRALRSMPGRAFVASKVTVSEENSRAGNLGRIRREMLGSIEESLRFLQTETIDVLQINNTSLKILHNEEVLRTLEEARHEGKVRFVGASFDVGEEVPLAALAIDCFDTLQVPFNVLDQRLAKRVLPLAAEKNVAALARSVLLRGVLTEHVHTVPEELAPLRRAALSAFERAKGQTQSLSELALRFCLSFEQIASVIIGVRSLTELEMNLAAAGKGGLPDPQIQQLRAYSVADEALINPQNWRGLK